MQAYKVKVDSLDDATRKVIIRSLVELAYQQGYKNDGVCYWDLHNIVALTFEESLDIEWYSTFDTMWEKDPALEVSSVQLFEIFSVKHTFTPFQEVLVRDVNDETWSGAHFSHMKMHLFIMIGNEPWKQCIPFKGNESLLGKV